MSKASSDWLLCNISKARLASINAIMEEIIDASDTNFKKLALHTARMGGKKLRPSLYLLALNTGDYYGKELLTPAAALELIHVASLHHDDVMDRADLRRNATSVNAEWGNLNATYSGNYLFSKAISILSQYDTTVNQITCGYISDLCLGQLKEAENAYNLKLSYEDHIDVLIKKTASLFELPCKLGALLSGASDDILEAITNYSKHMGIAFQLIDDLLDLKGNPHKTGKTVGTDLIEGVYTYATLYTLHETDHANKLTHLLTLDDMKPIHIQEAIELISLSGGLNAAKVKAKEHLEIAKNALSILPDNNTKTSLLNLTHFILARDH
ncbi:polyprenyl synthetase family protein [Flavivirga aquimarina]|uniref:Polyprenyl synthetase family protein n=1 Tax=Flavivirga aquimarina TaxID=2027862 RepID=A0ABT8WFU3_9FLAO|nr:polyprenyl synthetase family protein [Flavivirga aquimarina]MDO5972021.1 polyprenyl synthetase family protein [Flavivirga aquimarina]